MAVVCEHVVMALKYDLLIMKMRGIIMKEIYLAGGCFRQLQSLSACWRQHSGNLCPGSEEDSYD